MLLLLEEHRKDVPLGPDELMNAAIDNAISAFGKICFFQWDSIPDVASLVTRWLSWLPLRNDKEEMTLVCGLLSDFILRLVLNFFPTMNLRTQLCTHTHIHTHGQTQYIDNLGTHNNSDRQVVRDSLFGGEKSKRENAELVAEMLEQQLREQERTPYNQETFAEREGKMRTALGVLRLMW